MEDLDKLRELALHLVEKCSLSSISEISRTFSNLSDSSDPHLTSSFSGLTSSNRVYAQKITQIWKEQCPNVSGQVISEMVYTTALYADKVGNVEKTELVWTGPKSPAGYLRPTEQGLLDVIEFAREKLLIVAFAVYDVSQIIEAVEKALDREVEVTMILEHYDTRTRTFDRDRIKKLGEKICGGSQIYLWKEEHRNQEESDSIGCLHVKGAVSDDRHLFLSSANLTGHALTLNMEMGVLVTGGELPGKVRRHFEGLVEAGVLG